MSLMPKGSGEISKDADLDEVLGALTERVPGVRAAVIFDSRGLALSHVVKGARDGDVNLDEAAAVGAGLVRAAAEAIEATGGAGSESATSVWVRNDERNLYCVQLGERAFAAAVADPDVPAGLLMFRMDKWAAQAGDVIGDLADLAVPKRKKHKAIEAEDAGEMLAAVEVSAEEIGPPGVGHPRDIAEAREGAEGGGPSEATALYAAAAAAAGEAEEAFEELPSEDTVVVDLVESAPEPIAPEAVAPEPVAPEPIAPEPIAEAAPGLVEPEMPEPREPERPPALADAMQAWLAPPPEPIAAPASAAAAPTLAQAPPPVGPPVSLEPPPGEAGPRGLSGPPSGPPVAAFPPPGAAPGTAPMAPPPHGAPLASYPAPTGSPVAAPPPQGPPAVHFPRPSAEVWAPAPPSEEGSGDQSVPPWSAYGGPAGGAGGA